MKLSEIKNVHLSLRTEIEQFLKEHPDEFFSSKELSKALGKSPENICHHQRYSVTNGVKKYWTYTEKGRELLRRKLNGEN